MDQLNQDFLGFIELLEAEKVDYPKTGSICKNLGNFRPTPALAPPAASL
jgi:hypothetical protein